MDYYDVIFYIQDYPNFLNQVKKTAPELLSSNGELISGWITTFSKDAPKNAVAYVRITEPEQKNWLLLPNIRGGPTISTS